MQTKANKMGSNGIIKSKDIPMTPKKEPGGV